MMHGRLRLAALIVLAAGSALSAGQSPPASGQTPTFKVQVDYVDVDVLVTDEEGRFVRDLTQEDFQVFEDGKRQTITNFSVVDIPIERADRPLFAPGPIEPDVSTNAQAFEGRVYVLILDDLHTDALRSQRVKIAARQFIERNLGANDLMAIVYTGGRSDAGQEFTGNKRLLLAAVERFVGRKVMSATLARNEEYFRQSGLSGVVQDPFESERGFNAQSSLKTLKSVAEWFGSVRGRRKTILFMSEGIDYDLLDVIRRYDVPGNVAPMILEDIRETIAATSRSNVSIYAIDPRGLTSLGDDVIGVAGWADANPITPSPDDPEPSSGPVTTSRGIGFRSLQSELRMTQDSLRALADETNGFAVVNANDFTNAFERIVRDNSSYYVLAYYPPTAKRDGRFHKIDVRVSRPGLTVRARRGYVAPKGNPPAPRASNNDGASPIVVEALNSPLQVSGLTMRVFAVPFKGTPPNASVLLGVELDGRDLALTEKSRVELSYFAIDAGGKVRAGRTDRLTMNLRPESKARVERAGFRLLNRLNLPAGRYQLRVAAHDEAGGAVGAVSYDLEVPDFAKLPFGISGLALTSMMGSAAMTARPDEQLKDVLPAPPVALRTFPQRDEIALFAEIYDRPGSSPHTVDIVATVRSDEGTILFKHEDERSSAELQGKSGGYGYTARIPMSGLAPGWYVLTVEANSRLGQSASRQVEFEVTPSVR